MKTKEVITLAVILIIIIIGDAMITTYYINKMKCNCNIKHVEQNK